MIGDQVNQATQMPAPLCLLIGQFACVDPLDPEVLMEYMREALQKIPCDN